MAAIPMGNFTGMNFINLNDQQLAAALQDLIVIGSRVHHVPETAIRMTTSDPTVTTFDTVAQAVQYGNRFFDSVVYITLPADRRPVITHGGPVVPAGERTGAFISRRLFVFAMYLLIRGNIPTSDVNNQNNVVPSFFRNIYGVDYSPNQLIRSLANFDVRELDHSWIKHVNWNHLNIVARNRLGLGVAGYRSFAPFKNMQMAQTVQHNVNISVQARANAYNMANAIAVRQYDWNIHPITRDPNLINRLGNLNKNLGNLMLACFDDNQLNDMLNINMIFAIPVYDDRHRNFRNWHPNLITWQVDPIFTTPGAGN